MPSLPMRCKAIGCDHNVPHGEDLCAECVDLIKLKAPEALNAIPGVVDYKITASVIAASVSKLSIADRYPQYYKSVKGLEAIDVYKVHQLFGVNDPSGAIQHASKKLLLSGVRTGGKSQYEDIKEARDTLNRWLELHATEIKAA